MKRNLLTLLLATALLANLVGCATPSNAEQPDEKSNNEVVADPLSSGTTPTKADGSKVAEALAQQARDGDLQLLFTVSFSENMAKPSASFDEHIVMELETLAQLADSTATTLPDNYVNDYTNWRIETYGLSFLQSESEAEATPQATYGFTDCNETVYATGTVNLRSGPGTDYDKVGSLSAGQSVTRTGIGTGSAEGWSRVQLDDSNIVYVNNNYISTSKPAPRQNATTSSTTNQGATQASGILDDRGIGGANGITDDMFVHNEDLYPGMTPEEMQQAARDINNQSEFRIQGAT